MLHARRGVLDLDIGHGMRPALVADQQAVALGVVAAVGGARVHRHQTAIGVLRPARRDALGHDARAGVLAKMDHLGPGVGLLGVVGDGDRVELALAFLAPQDAGRVFPGDGRAGFHLRPHHLGAGLAAVGALGDEVVDAALAFLVAGEPVLDGRVFHLGVFQHDDFHHRGVKLGGVTLGRGAAFQVADVAALVGDDQRALELAGVLGVDAEIGGQLHRAADARRDVDKGSVRKHGRVQRREEVVRRRHDRAEVLPDQFGMLADRFRDRAEDHAGLRQFILEGRPHADGIEDRVHGHPAGVVAALDGRGVGAFDPGQDRLFLQRNAQLLIGRQQGGIDLVQRLGLDGHAFRTRVVILVLIVDLGIVQHRPARLGHALPAAEGGQAPLGHPLGLVVLLADQPDDVLVDALGGVFHLDLGVPPVFVGPHVGDGLDRLTVDAFADFDLGRVQNGHRLPSLLALPTGAGGKPRLGKAVQFLGRRRSSERDAQRAAGIRLGHAHRAQHPAGPDLAGTAS